MRLHQMLHSVWLLCWITLTTQLGEHNALGPKQPEATFAGGFSKRSRRASANCATFDSQAKNYFAISRDGVRRGSRFPSWYLDILNTFDPLDNAAQASTIANKSNKAGERECFKEFYASYCSQLPGVFVPLILTNIFASLNEPRFVDPIATGSVTLTIVNTLQYPPDSIETKRLFIIAFFPVQLLFGVLNFVILFKSLKRAFPGLFVLHASVVVLNLLVYIFVAFASAIPFLILFSEPICNAAGISAAAPAATYDVPYRMLESLVFLNNIYLTIISLERVLALTMSQTSHGKLFSRNRMIFASVLLFILNIFLTLLHLLPAGYYVYFGSSDMNIQVAKLASAAIAGVQGLLLAVQLISLLFVLTKFVMGFRVGNSNELCQSIGKIAPLLVGTVLLNIPIEIIHIMARTTKFSDEVGIAPEDLYNPVYKRQTSEFRNIVSSIYAVTGFYLMPITGSLLGLLLHLATCQAYRNGLLVLLKLKKNANNVIPVLMVKPRQSSNSTKFIEEIPPKAE